MNPPPFVELSSQQIQHISINKINGKPLFILMLFRVVCQWNSIHTLNNERRWISTAASFYSFSYKGGKGKGKHVSNRAVICRRTLPKPSQLHRNRQKHPEFIHTFENLRCLEHSSRNPVHLIYRHRTRWSQEANHSTGEKISLEYKKWSPTSHWPFQRHSRGKGQTRSITCWQIRPKWWLDEPCL